MLRRFRAWLASWGTIVPLLVAESAIWVGFGALLPILPIYYTEHGVDLPTLGVVVAAWPAARLLGEPMFGWVADRLPRRTMMIAGLLLTSVFTVWPLFVTGSLAFIALRALQGLASAMYDPAARSYLVDANPPERQGEAFGLYGSSQTGGFMLGPALGGIAAGLAGSAEIVFWVAGASLIVSALLVLVLVPDLAPTTAGGRMDDAAGEPEALPAAASGLGWRRPQRVVNLLLVVAICFNIGSFFAGGSYEVVWSLYLTSLGADIGLIGLTFFSFGLPPLLLSPFMGRFVDRHGGYLALAVGLAGVAGCGIIYPIVPAVWWMVVIGLVEGTAFAMVSPAVYLLAARASPVGRSSTVQGLLGGAGTVGMIVASIAAGRLAEINLTWPFYSVGVVGLLALAVGLTLGRRRLYDAMQPRQPAAGTRPVPASGT